MQVCYMLAQDIMLIIRRALPRRSAAASPPNRTVAGGGSEASGALQRSFLLVDDGEFALQSGQTK